MALDRLQQPHDLRRRVVQDGDDRQHPAASASTARVSRAARSTTGRRPPRRRAPPARCAGPGRRRGRAGRRPAPPRRRRRGRAARRPRASRRRPAGRRRSRGVPNAGGLDGRQAEALQPRRLHDGDRAAVQRGQRVVAHRPGEPHAVARHGAGETALAGEDELGAEPAGAGGGERACQQVRRLARLERSDGQEVPPVHWAWAGKPVSHVGLPAQRWGEAGAERTTWMRDGGTAQRSRRTSRVASETAITAAARSISRAYPCDGMPRALVAREVGGPQDPREVRGRSRRRARRARSPLGRERGAARRRALRRRRRAASRSSRRPPGERGGAEQRAAAERVADERRGRVVDRLAAGYEGDPGVVGERRARGLEQGAAYGVRRRGPR